MAHDPSLVRLPTTDPRKSAGVAGGAGAGSTGNETIAKPGVASRDYVGTRGAKEIIGGGGKTSIGS